MSDGIPKHDWRQLRDKTKAEIEEHRKIAKLQATGGYPATHFDIGGKSYCGVESRYFLSLSPEKEKVTCGRCRRTMATVRTR